MNQLRRVGIFGVGSYAPERVVKNDDFKQWVDTSDEWISSRTGIRERRWAGENEFTSDMATAAARKALDQAGWQPNDLDFIIVGTCTGDNSFPNTANYVARNLGVSNRCGAIDAGTACSGFVYTLAMASGMIASGQINRALVIGAEKLSSIVNVQDRTTCIIFGDGAGAVVIRALEPEEPDHGTLLAHHLGSEFHYDALSLPAGGSRIPATHESVEKKQHAIHMNGRTIYKFAVNTVQEEIERIVKLGGHELADVDYIVPHQVNARILESAAEKLGMSLDKFHMNIERYGNTSAASVPLALDEAISAGKVKLGAGKLVVLIAFGGGLSWGSQLLRT